MSLAPRPATDSPSSDAWGFVLQHSTTIARAARHVWSDRRVDYEDFHHELVIDISRNFYKFDADRSSPGTWVYVRARKTKDRTLRSLKARKDRAHDTLQIMGIQVEDVPMIDPAVSAGEFGSAESMIARVTIGQVIRAASPLQAEAAVSAMEGWTGEEVRESFGCSMSARNDRLNRLGRRMEKGDVNSR